MANPVFPTLTLARGGQDSQTYSVQLEDVAIKSEMEGGYVVSRARHTRAPRRTFNVNYKAITDADRKTLETFYGTTVRGGSVIFDWTDPIDLQTWQVRFQGELTFDYAGVGVSKLWDVTFKVQQA
jgi:hypothetical protein